MVEHLERDERNAKLSELRHRLFARAIDRREFVNHATSLGLAAPAVAALAHVYGASAGPSGRSSTVRLSLQYEPQNPITITVGGSTGTRSITSPRIVSTLFVTSARARPADAICISVPALLTGPW